MPSVMPSMVARQCLGPRAWGVRASLNPLSAGHALSIASAASHCYDRDGSFSTNKSLHTLSPRAQAVEVASRAQAASSASTLVSESFSDVVRRSQTIVDPSVQALGREWKRRADLLSRKIRSLETLDHVPIRLLLAGSSLSQTQKLLAAMIDEPLREVSGSQTNEAEMLLSRLSNLAPSTPFTIKFASGPMQFIDGTSATLDRHWLQNANFQLTVLLDPRLSESNYDLVYDSEAVLFVTDDYALSRSAFRSHTAGERGDAILELVSRFASKPNTHLVVNSILGQSSAQIIGGLEAATGASVSDLLAPNLIPVCISDALSANTALRHALDQTHREPPSRVNGSEVPAAYWDEFSSQYQRSNVGSLIDLIQSLEFRHGSTDLVSQSSTFLLQHCLDEALATAKRNMATLYQMQSLAKDAKEREQFTLKHSLERVWPPSSAYTGQLTTEKLKVWRPASPGSPSAVDEAMQETDALIESTFDTKLQWWKLIWKVDDVRKELETACAGFAASLESDLAYESGRLAMLQVEQVRTADRLLLEFRRLARDLESNIGSASRDIALLTNEAEAYRSSKLRTIEPSTLMEPIHRRRTQLLETGGPIDVLAAKSRRLVVTSSAAVAVTAAGIGSASVLGASLGMDASTAALALDPSTGLGLGLLTLTLASWRMQGQFNKYRRRFRQDWQRFSQGLDQDLKGNFETVLKQQITGQSNLVSSRILDLAQSWTSTVQRQENHAHAVASQASRSLPAPAQQSESNNASHSL